MPVRTAKIIGSLIEMHSEAGGNRFLLLHRAPHLVRQFAGIIAGEQPFDRHFYVFWIAKQLQAIFQRGEEE